MHLADKHGFTILSFAFELKMELVAAGFDYHDVWLKPTSPEMRALLQAWGTMRRKQDPMYWIDKLMLKVERAIEDGRDIAIDDMRYVNEAEALAQEGAVLVRVKKLWYGHNTTVSCQSLNKYAPMEDRSAERHPSECDLDDYMGFDYSLEANEGDLEALRARIDGIVERETKLPGVEI
jgi:hypothetical protein